MVVCENIVTSITVNSGAGTLRVVLTCPASGAQGSMETTVDRLAAIESFIESFKSEMGGVVSGN